MRRWASQHGIDLRQSWAYSDSVYDAPLLAAVGHATAVNPDLRLHAMAILRRWPVVHLDSPAGVPKVFGAEAMDMVRLLFPQLAIPYARFDIAGTEHIPRQGPAIVAANHRSYFDPMVYGLAVFEAGRNPRGLAKKELFDAPVVGMLMRASGAICVDRKQSGRRRLPAGGAGVAQRRGADHRAPGDDPSRARRSSTLACGASRARPVWRPPPAPP